MKKNSCNNNAFQMHAFQKIQKRAEKSTQKKKKKITWYIREINQCYTKLV